MKSLQRPGLSGTLKATTPGKPDQLRALSKELFERLGKEEARAPEVPATHLVGGIVKAASKLEGFLRELVAFVANADGVEPERVLDGSVSSGSRPKSFRKRTAGELAHGLKSYVEGRAASSLPPIVRPILDDLHGHRSHIVHFILVRNEIAKEGGDPGPGRAAGRKLQAVIGRFRKDAGWE